MKQLVIFLYYYTPKHWNGTETNIITNLIIVMNQVGRTYPQTMINSSNHELIYLGAI